MDRRTVELTRSEEPPQERPGGSTGDDNVVPLGVDPPPPEPAPEVRPFMGRLHGLSILGMALSALLGIASMLAFITITWPDNLGRYVIAVFAFSVISFMTCASIAVFSAARDTYARSDTES